MDNRPKLITTLNNLRLLLLGAWLGAAIFFSATVAPTAFRVLRGFRLTNAGEIAGTIVNQTLGVVNVTGVVIGLLLIIVTFGLRKIYGRGEFLFQLVLLFVIVAGAAIGEWVIAARMRTLRTAMAIPIDQVPLDEPARVAFQALHGYSVAALAIAIIAGLIAFFVIAQRRVA